MERRLFNRRELPILLVMVLAAALWLVLSRTGPEGTRAIVERDGETILTKELGGLEAPELVEIVGKNGITLTLEFSREGARVLEASCPDKTCRRAGLLTRAGESAVCLPGRIVLRLEGPRTGQNLDAETY